MLAPIKRQDELAEHVIATSFAGDPVRDQLLAVKMYQRTTGTARRMMVG